MNAEAKTPGEWLKVFSECSPTRSASEITFTSIVGMSPNEIHYIWITYMEDSGYQQKELLWTASFLYVYSKNDASMAAMWGCATKTFHDAVFNCLFFLRDELDEVHWSDRLVGQEMLEGGLFANVFTVVGTIDCPIGSALKNEGSGYKKKSMFKYEAAVSLVSGKFVWAPVPGLMGTDPDQDSFRFYSMNEKMGESEKFLGNSHYVGLPKCFIETLEDMKHLKSEVGKVSGIVQHGFSRLKNFSCLKLPWRHNRKLHFVAYSVCVHLTNIKLKTKPLRAIPLLAKLQNEKNENFE